MGMLLLIAILVFQSIPLGESGKMLINTRREAKYTGKPSRGHSMALFAFRSFALIYTVFLQEATTTEISSILPVSS